MGGGAHHQTTSSSGMAMTRLNNRSAAQRPVVRDLFPVSESSLGGCAVVPFAVFLVLLLPLSSAQHACLLAGPGLVLLSAAVSEF